MAFVGLAGRQATILARRLAPNSAWAGWAGLLVAGEPHILWSGLSGMETAAALWVVLVMLSWAVSGASGLKGGDEALIDTVRARSRRAKVGETIEIFGRPLRGLGELG